MKNRVVHQLLQRLVSVQLRHPGRVLLVASAATLAGLLGVLQLHLDSSYEVLLPTDLPQIVQAREIRERTGGTRQIVVALDGANPDARVTFARSLAPRLEAVEGVRWVDVEFPLDFFRDRALWLLELEELEELVTAAEVAVGAFRENNDRRALELFWQRANDTVESRRLASPFGDRFLHSRDGQYTFLLVRPSVSITDLPGGRQLLERLGQTIEEAGAAEAGLGYEFAGTFRLYQEQPVHISRDLRRASVIALLFGVAVVAGLTRRWGAPVVVACSLLPGIVWTFGVIRLFTTRITMVTGFLTAVLIGLGIDFGIHLYVRFRQERQRSVDILSAIDKAVQETFPPALVSAATTAATFLVFSVAPFPPFREFGLIAGTGVLLTFTSTFVIMPSLLSLVAPRQKPPTPLPPETLSGQTTTGHRSLPRAAALGVVIAFVAAIVASGLALSQVEFRNNFRELRGHSPATEFNDYVSKNLGMGFNPAVVLSPSLADTGRIAAFARSQASTWRDNAPRSDAMTLGRVIAASDLVPHQVAERQQLIGRLQALFPQDQLTTLVPRERISAEQLEMIQQILNAEPWSWSDLPPMVTRRFATLDGQDFLTFLWPSRPVDSDQRAYSWERFLNHVTHEATAAGLRHSLADEALIVGWVTSLAQQALPRVLPAALAVVLLLLALDFRSLRQALVTATPLLAGMFLFVGLMSLVGVDANMFNVVVIPSIIGIGIDGVVHMHHRYHREGPGSMLLVIRHTGAAIFLASLTTAVGFGASLVSYHQGLQSMGALALLGILATYLSSVLLYPALMVLLEKRPPVVDKIGPQDE